MDSSTDVQNNDYSLIISTDEDCDILVNGKNLGKTKDKKIKISKLVGHREYLIEAVSETKYGKIKVKPTGQFNERHIILKPKPGSILAKSKTGDFKLIIHGETYDCPGFIKHIRPGIHNITIQCKDIVFKESIEVLSGKIFEYELTEENLKENAKKNRVDDFNKIINLPEDNIDQWREKVNQLAIAVQEYKEFDTESALADYHKLIKRIQVYEKEQKRIEISRKLEREHFKKKAIPVSLIAISSIIVIILIVWGIGFYSSYKKEKSYFQLVSQSNSINELNIYFEKFGKNGKYAKEISERINFLENEKKDFLMAEKKNTIESFENYLSKYGKNAIFKQKAREYIDKLEFLKTLPEVLKKYNLVEIVSGDFFMGSPRLVREDLLNNKPQMFLSINPFYMGKYEVTFKEYDEFCIETGRKLPSDNRWGRENRPVVNVSFNDAHDYCKWLSEKTGFHFRLPSEVEWEYACRAKSTTKYYWGDNMNKRYCVNGKVRRGKTSTVGTKRPNNFGLYDMSGNVYEWCEDSYETEFKIRGSSYKFPNLYKKNSAGNPVFTEWGDKRIIRGGDYRSSDFSCYSYQRNATSPDSKLKSVGFRVVMDIPSINLD